MRKFTFTSFIFFLIFVFNFPVYGQISCSSPQIICIGSTYFCDTSGIIESSANYSCLSVHNYPNWFYIRTGTGGNIDLNFNSTNNTDIDFVCWGPYDSLSNVCNLLDTNHVVACSYSNSSSETCNIPVSAVGKYFLICITNYAGTPTNALITQTGGSGSTFCISNNSPLCSENSLVLSATFISGATYSWTGPNGFTSTDQNPVINNVTPVNSGIYTLIYTSGTYTSSPLSTNVTVYTLPIPGISSNSPVCAGKGIQLFSSGGVSYVWNGPNGFTSTLQNPAINLSTSLNSGQYIVMVTDSIGCSNRDTTVVQVAPLPTVTIVTNSPKCPGDSIKLIATGNGIYFHWTGPNGFTSTLQSVVRPNANTSMAGLYVVIITGSNGCTAHATANYSISTTISTSTNAPVCESDTLKLFAAGAWNNYHWSGPNGFTSSLQNPKRAPSSVTMSGFYFVTVSNNTGCSATDTTAIVLVHSKPNVTQSGNFPNQCENGPLFHLSGGFPTGGTYSGTAVTNNVFNPNLAGMEDSPYTIRYIFTDSNGCSDSASSQITVSAPPVINVSHNNPCTGNSINLSSGSPTGTGFYWTGPSGFTSSASNPVILNSDTSLKGTYMVIVSDNLGCADTATTIVMVRPLPVVTFYGALMHQCSNSSTYNITGGNPPGGTYHGLGVNGTNFNASSVGITGSPYLITYQYTDNYGCRDSAINYIRVDTLPQLSATSSSPTCYGDSLILSCTTNGTIFSWTGPNSFSSSAQNPVDPYFIQSGNYFLTVTDTNGCQSSRTIPTQMLPLGTIHGLLKLEDQILFFPLNTRIELYKEESGFFRLYDTIVTWSGFSFIFNNVIPGNYLLKVNLNIPFYPYSIPTYYPGTNLWFYADTIMTTCYSDLWLTVKLQEYSPSKEGQCEVSGHVYYSLATDSIFHPVSGINLFLENEKEKIWSVMDHKFSDTSGYYEFLKIPLSAGLKRVMIDHICYPIISNYDLYFSSKDTVFRNIDFFIDTTSSGWGIYKLNTTAIRPLKFNDFSINIFPNPTWDIINLSYHLNKPSNVKIDFIDDSGRLLDCIVNSYQDISDQNLTYSLKNKPSGIYFLKISVNNTVFLKKIIFSN